MMESFSIPQCGHHLHEENPAQSLRFPKPWKG
jgi:hypothetical protein